jgi:hypothetical protein
VAAVPEKKRIHIVASPRPRSGTTLLARLIAERLAFAGERCIAFDTAGGERRLSSYFLETTEIDLERVADQMKLFDAFVAAPGASQVIDVGHRQFARFFALCHSFDYFSEAAAAGIEPVLFFAPDNSIEAFDAGLQLHKDAPELPAVLVRNAVLGEPDRALAGSTSYTALRADMPLMRLARLDPLFVTAMDDPRLSLSEFMRRSTLRQSAPPLTPGQMSLAYLSLETRNAIATWLRSAFDEIRRALAEVDRHKRPARPQSGQVTTG